MGIADASYVAPFSYVTLVFASFYDFALFSQIPDNYSLIGASLILAGAFILAWREKVKPARMTVRLNGFVVQDDVELTHATGGSPLDEGLEPGPVYLQDHSNPVVYQNIWVVETK